MIFDYNYKLAKLESSIKSLKTELKEAKIMTTKVLASCKKHGIKRVSIGAATEKIESAKKWSQSSFGCGNSLFADERGENWPAIWAVTDEVGIHGGCGNTGQSQVNTQKPLIKGVYELEGNIWRKID